jgi:hypothetical protein
MKKTFLLPILVVLMPLSVSADPETYDAYKTRLAATCEDNKEWSKDTSWGGDYVLPPTYPELTRSAIENTRTNLLSESNSAEERQNLVADLDIPNLKAAPFRTLELTRIMYRSRMNKVFGCAVIQSRENITKNLLAEIEKKYPSGQSEIKEKIKREGERLKVQKDALSCRDQWTENKTPSLTRVVNAATRQYCHYDTYLRYLRDNLDENTSGILTLERNLWTDPSDAMTIPGELEPYAREIATKWELITSEILRIRSVLPRAIATFQDMDRTYEMHLLLVVIYDDYVKLRDNLAIYFNAVTQLMEKMQNAQLPNNN